MVVWLGQSGGASGNSSVLSAVVLVLVLLTAVLVLGLVLMKVRRIFFGPQEDAETGGLSLPLDELRRLRDSGELSEAEYARAVEAIADAARGPK